MKTQERVEARKTVRSKRKTSAPRIATMRNTDRMPVGFLACKTEAGAEADEPITLPEEAHVMTIAPTGAGKGVSGTVPILLQYPGSMIVLDPKGEQAAITARRRRELGQATYVIDPFGMSGLPAASYNPLDFVEAEMADSTDNASAIADILLPASLDPRNLFWRNRAAYFLTSAILHAAADYPPEERNMLTVRDTVHKMTAACHKPPGQPAAEPVLRSCHPDVMRISDLFGLGAPETLGSMLHFAMEGVGFVRGPLLEQSLARSSFSLDDLTEGVPMTIYLVLPPHLVATHGSLLRLWLGTLFGALTRRRCRPEHATLLLLDEAAQLGTFPPLRTALTLLRGYGVQTWSFWQQASQLEELYPADWKSLVGNCRVVQCFGAQSPAAWQQLADVLGVDINAFGKLDDNAMLMMRNGEVRIVDRLDYRTDRAMQGMFDPNPIYERVCGPLRRTSARLRPHGAASGCADNGEQADATFRRVCLEIGKLW